MKKFLLRKLRHSLLRREKPAPTGTDQIPNSIGDLRLRIQSNPGDSKLYYLLACEYFRKRDFFRAVAHNRTALALGNDEHNITQTRLLLGECYLNIGLFDLAAKEFLAVIANTDDTVQKSTALERLTQAVPDAGQLDSDELVNILADSKGGLMPPQKFHLIQNTWKLEYLPPGKYQRLKLVSDKIKRAFDTDMLVADVGGGDGSLCLFLPNHHCVLIDKEENGLDATDEILGPDSFDIVVTCDTMEHIPKSDRWIFVENLIRIARHRVYLLAPFGESNRELDKIAHKIAPNPWTEQHLLHEYTTLAEMRTFLKKRNLEYAEFPCSFEPAHLAITILAVRFLSGMPQLQRPVYEFYNRNYCDVSRLEPSYGYLFEIFTKSSKLPPIPADGLSLEGPIQTGGKTV